MNSETQSFFSKSPNFPSLSQLASFRQTLPNPPEEQCLTKYTSNISNHNTTSIYIYLLSNTSCAQHTHTSCDHNQNSDMSAGVASAAISGYQNSSNSSSNHSEELLTTPQGMQQVSSVAPPLSRYESQKRRDWNTFGQYLKNHRPPLTLSRCSGAHVLEFLRYLDQFGKTKVHSENCAYFGNPHPPGPCPCPLKQAWGSLDALVGRLRAAFEENGGSPEMNPFGARAVRLYLREVRDAQAKARGIAYEKKKKRKPPHQKQQQNGGSVIMEEDHQVLQGSYGGGFVDYDQLSNSNAVSYFLS